MGKEKIVVINKKVHTSFVLYRTLKSQRFRTTMLLCFVPGTVSEKDIFEKNYSITPKSIRILRG